jgi:hypothetical protein
VLNRFTVLVDWLVDLLLAALLLAGLLQLSEIGFLAADVEQDSFFRARGEFVGIRDSAEGSDIVTLPAGRIVLRSKRYDGAVSAPRWLGPEGRCTDGTTFPAGHRFCGKTAVPDRGTR